MYTLLKPIILYFVYFLQSLSPSNQFVEGVVGQPRSFFPNQTITENDKTISKLIYRGLFKYDNYGVLVPDLAENWSVSNDGLVYRMKIKSNQFWSDGKKINSDDLIYSAFKSKNLRGVATDKVDDRTVIYTLPNKFSPFLSLLTEGVMQSGSEEVYNPLIPISNGPFTVARIVRSGPIIKEIVLLNDGFPIEKLIFRFYSNEDELRIAAELQEIDGFISSSDKIKVENFNHFEFPIQSVYYALFFNLDKDNLKDLAFREKLQKVLNIENLTKNYGILVEGPISRSAFTDKSLIFNNFDEEFSEDLDNRELTLTVPDTENQVKLAREIKREWETKLNLKVNIKKVNSEKINKTIIEKRDYEILLYGQEIDRDPDRYVNWHSTQKVFPGLNITGFEHVKADRALEEGRNETDNNKRLTHYKVFQSVINENIPTILLYHPLMHYYISDRIHGIGEKYTFVRSDRFLDFANWKRISTN